MADMPDTQDSLIAQLRDANNFDAWEAFAQIYRPVVYRLARARGLQHADADDLSQQVMMSVARAIPNWQREPQARFRHWLARIVRNATINALSRGRQDRAAGGSDFLSAHPQRARRFQRRSRRRSRPNTNDKSIVAPQRLCEMKCMRTRGGHLYSPLWTANGPQS